MSRLPSLGPRGEGWFALQLALLASIVAAGLLLGLDWHGLARVVSSLVGGLLLAAGLLLGARGVLDLGRSVSPLPRPLTDGELVEHGAYRMVRHPIYAGLILAAAGWSLLAASLSAVLLALVLALLLDLKARREEQWLLQRYPEYAEYTRSTRRFVPGIY